MVYCPVSGVGVGVLVGVSVGVGVLVGSGVAVGVGEGVLVGVGVRVGLTLEVGVGVSVPDGSMHSQKMQIMSLNAFLLDYYLTEVRIQKKYIQRDQN